jgi:N-methylhydantoinase A
MENALRVISLEKGYDTRDFTLVTFGGAGGLHACDLARSLLIPRVLVPLHPGALSAIGVLRSDLVQDASQTDVMSTKDADLIPELEKKLQALAEQVVAKMADQGFDAGEVELEKSVDARYLGQSFEINTPFSGNLVSDFHQLHEQFYGYCNPQLPVETINLRVRGRARYALPPLPSFPLASPDSAAEAVVQEKQIVLDGQSVAAKFYARQKLKAGGLLPGPAVIVEYSSTTLVPADHQARVDEYLNLIIEPKASPV